jgi:DNA-binding LacI/PurR family transcriptional regulator
VPTIRDVAREAGVSIATVSRVMNRIGRYSAETERLVLEAAERVGYAANLPARILKTGVARTIGLVAAECILVNSPALLSAAGRVLRANGFAIQLFPGADLGECVTVAREKRVDGLLLAFVGRDDRALARLLKTGTAFVLLGGDVEREDVNLVEIDFFQGGYLATQHLLHLGHRDILFAQDRPRSLPSGEILRGHLFALDESGIQYREELTGSREAGYAGDSNDAAPAARDAGGNEGAGDRSPLDGGPPDGYPLGLPLEREGYERVGRALGRGGAHARFSAVLATDDRIAYGALRALEEQGLGVPEDRSVAGFGDAGPSAYLHKPLTTVDVPYRQQGELGAEILVNNILRKDEVVKRVKLKVHLIRRETTSKVLTA